MADVTQDPSRTQEALNYPELHFINPDLKDELWMAKNIAFAKWHCKPLVDPKDARMKRMLDDGRIDAQAYKEIFDPEGRKAEYIAADWKSCPIYVHLNHIQEARLKKIPTKLTVKAIDEFAKLKQMKENARIIGRREYLNFLNEMNRQFGLPQLKPADDPYKYAKQMQQKLTQKDGRKMGDTITPDGLVDAIRNSIYDNEDLALYNSYIYKGDVEVVMELGIQHILKTNKFKRIASKLIRDLKNHNRYAMRWYTSLTNGKPIIEYLDVAQVYTFEFTEEDGNDNVGWFIEYDMTYSDFMRKFGAGLTTQQLIDVFDRNEKSGAMNGFSWFNASDLQKYKAKIRVGYIEVETQDRMVFSEGQILGNLHFKQRDYEWKESQFTRRDARRSKVEKNYNVWYCADYIPPTAISNGGLVHADTITGQAKFVFQLRKLQDMQRFGDERRWAKSSLIVWKGMGMSFADIMERFMPKINYLWLDIQNDLVQNNDGGIYSDEILKSMMASTDESFTTNGINTEAAKKAFLQKLTQTGMGLAKLTDAEGKPVEIFKAFSTGHLNAAGNKMVTLQNMYLLMLQALAMSNTGEGQDPRPRTSVKGLEFAHQAGQDASYFLTDAWIDGTEELGERCVTYIKQISEEGDTQRFQDFRDVVGQANGLMLEEIKDIPFHKFGATVENEDDSELRTYVQGLAENLAKAGMLDIEVVTMMLKVDNWKYAAVLMIMKYKQKVREKMAEEERKNQFLKEMKGLELQVEIAKYKNKELAKIPVIQAQADVDAKLIELEGKVKSLTQSLLQEQRKNNRIEQDLNKDNLKNRDEGNQAGLRSNFGVPDQFVAGPLPTTPGSPPVMTAEAQQPAPAPMPQEAPTEMQPPPDAGGVPTGPENNLPVNAV